MFANISTLLSLSILVLFSLMSEVESMNKYSKEANEFKKDDTPFKMRKVNAFWKKASKMISSDEELADLVADLNIQDKYEAELKQLQTDGRDKSGAREEMVLDGYHRLSKKWFPEPPAQDDLATNQIPADDGDDGDDRANVDVQFDDPKLKAMWARALAEGFSEHDLQILKEEFEHQEIKLQDFHQMRRDIFGHQDSELDLDNTVDTDDSESNLSPEDVDDMSEAELLKDYKIKVKEGFEHLENTLAALPHADPLFEDHRVLRLWAQAKATNWTAMELSSFQEELHHFENKVNKHSHYRKELETVKVDLKKGVKDAKERQQWLTERAGHMKKRMYKIHDDLQMKVDQGLKHSEL